MIKELIKRKVLEVCVMLFVIVGFVTITNLFYYFAVFLGICHDKFEFKFFNILLSNLFLGFVFICGMLFCITIICLLVFGIYKLIKYWIQVNLKSIKKKHNYLFNQKWLTIKRASIISFVLFFIILGWITVAMVVHQKEIQKENIKKEQQKQSIILQMETDKHVVLYLVSKYKENKLKYPIYKEDDTLLCQRKLGAQRYIDNFFNVKMCIPKELIELNIIYKNEYQAWLNNPFVRGHSKDIKYEVSVDKAFIKMLVYMVDNGLVK